jgi:hypothetical protein
MRKYLKEKEKDLHEVNGTNNDKLELQNILLQDNYNSLILKENSILSLFNSCIKEGKGVLSLGKITDELLRKEKDINQRYGAVHFFLLPEITRQTDQDPSFLNLQTRCIFFENINSYSVSQGLNIEIIHCHKDDKIYDIRDRILEVLNKKYQI